MEKKNSNINKRDIKEIIKSRKFIGVVAALAIIIPFLIIISTAFISFTSVRLKTNNKERFNISDLVVNNLKFGSTEKEIEKELGKPNKTSTKINNNYEYKVYEYDGLTLTLKENYSDYILVKAEITSSKYKTSRGIRVKSKISKAVNKFSITNKTGNYIYKNYNIEALDTKTIKDNIYLGVRNSKQVIYYNRDAIVDGVDTCTAKLELDYKFGKIQKIVWSYDL